MLGGDFAVHRARSDTRFTTPNPSIANATTAAERTVSDYRLGSMGGAYSFPTEQGVLVVGASFHQTNTFGRGFDVLGENRTSSITGTFLPNRFSFDDGELFIEDSRSRIAFEAGAIDTSSAAFANGEYPFIAGASPQSPAVDGQMTLDQQENLLESGQMNELSFGAAVEVAPGVMLGGGLNIAFGSYTFERFYRETDASDLLPPDDPANPQVPYDPYFLEGTTLEGFNTLRFEEEIDTDINGISLRAGLSAEVASGLRWGLLVETPTWYNLTEVFGTRIATDFDCDFGRSGAPCPVGGVTGLESGSLTANEFSYRIRTPWRLGTGLQYTRSGLTLAGDVEVVDWTQANVSSDDASFGDLNRQIRGLNTTINTRAGAEYDFDVAAVRAGVAYRPDPRDQSFQDVDGQSTDGDRLFLSAGASFTPSENFTLHLNWMQERFDDTFQSYTDGPFVREAVAQNQFLIGVTYRP
jgi:opacity protein-like surface antigen